MNEDPVFLGSPSGQNLADPQSLNTYSYSDDNPINKSDPSGKVLVVDDALELSSPIWIPVVATGVTIAATGLYDATQNLLRNLPRTGSQPFDTRRLVSVPDPNLFGDNPIPPNINPKAPLIGLILLGTGVIASAVKDFADTVKDGLDTGNNLKNQNPNQITNPNTTLNQHTAPQFPTYQQSSHLNNVVPQLSPFGNNIGKFVGTYNFGNGVIVNYGAVNAVK
jgi:hypothetical protein